MPSLLELRRRLQKLFLPRESLRPTPNSINNPRDLSEILPDPSAEELMRGPYFDQTEELWYPFRDSTSPPSQDEDAHTTAEVIYTISNLSQIKNGDASLSTPPQKAHKHPTGTDDEVELSSIHLDTNANSPCKSEVADSHNFLSNFQSKLSDHSDLKQEIVNEYSGSNATVTIDLPTTPPILSWKSNNPYLTHVTSVGVRGSESVCNDTLPKLPHGIAKDEIKPSLVDLKLSNDVLPLRSIMEHQNKDSPLDPPSKSPDKITLSPPSISSTGIRSIRFTEPLVIKLSPPEGESDIKLKIKTHLNLPMTTTNLGTWTKNAFDKFKSHATFRDFLREGRVVEWRRYRERHTFVAARHRNEYLVVKIQASGVEHYLQFNRLIHQKDREMWQRYDKRWLDWVNEESPIDPTYTKIPGHKGGLPWELDRRLIWGSWTPYDRIMPLENWPNKDTLRETKEFSLTKHQPDLVDLLIAARLVHLNTSFNLYKRQGHWFTKILSRVLNQGYEADDVYSTTDRKKYDKEFDPVAAKWGRSRMISEVRHEKVLELRKRCVSYREELEQSDGKKFVLEEVQGDTGIEESLVQQSQNNFYKKKWVAAGEKGVRRRGKLRKRK
ncbi:hypothetical protein H0H87_004433 [Tephrocybe sp. NHM501043]|nr:hypothetical protein H0H87_004433 [Tephrocybe sp. NHM501043]